MGRTARRRREKDPGAPQAAAVARPLATRTSAPVRRGAASEGSLTWILAPAVVLLVGIGLYANSFTVPYLLDDQIEIVRSKQITQLEPLWQYLTRARGVVGLSLALNYRWNGFDVFGYHLVNLCIHLVNGLLVYALVLLTLRLPYFAGRYNRHAPYLALATSLVFVAHPMQTMAVTYIIQRAESLASLFYLLALLLFVYGATASRGWVQGVAYAGAVVASLLGVLTKQIVATVPLTVILYQLCFLRGERKERSWPQWVAVGLLFGVLAIAVATSWRYFVPKQLGNKNLLASIFIDTAGFSVEGLTPWQYLMTQFGVVVWYLRLFLLPTLLCFDYGWRFADTFWRADVILPFLVLLAMAGIAVAAINRYRLATFCLGWFFITLAPSSSFFPIRDAAFEYRMYLPIVGLAWLAVVGLYDAGGWAAQRWNLRLGTVHQFLGVAAAVWIAVLGMFTVARNVVYQDPMRLAADTAAKAPNHWRAHYEYGRLLMEQKHFDEAIAEFNEAIRCEPTKGPPRLHLAQIYMQRGNYDEAEIHLEAAKQGGERSIVAAAHRQMGFVYNARKRPFAAMNEFEKAAFLMPDWLVVRRQLARLYADKQQWLEASRHYEAALRLSPKDEALKQEAAPVFETAGLVAFFKDKPDEAVYLLSLATQNRFTLTTAHEYLAISYAALGEWEKAETAMSIAARQKPNDATITTNLQRLRNREVPYLRME